MDAVEKKILNNYLGLLERLSTAMKLRLIDKLSKSVQSNVSVKSKMKSAFGGWNSDESADDLIERIRNSRNTNRKLEEL